MKRTAVLREMRSSTTPRPMFSSTRQSYARPSRRWVPVRMKGSAGSPMGSTNWSRWPPTPDPRVGSAMVSGRMGAVPMDCDASSDMRR